MRLRDVTRESITGETLLAGARERLARSLRTLPAGLVARSYPSVRADLIRKADLALAGRLVLPGTGAEPYFVGDPPRWHDDPFGNDEYVWELNRMWHWPTLLWGHALTGDPRYARKIVTELEDWLERVPRPRIEPNRDAMYKSFYGPTPWRSLEAGIRMFWSVYWAFTDLVPTPFFTPDLISKLAVSVHEHAEVLAEVCPVFWPRADHNHYLMENLGLLCAVAMFPELRGADAWRTHALGELERCAEAQLTEGGGQIEGCPSYHNICVAFFGQAVEVAHDNGWSFSPRYMARVARAIDYSVQACRPTGTVVPWGDSDLDLSAIDACVWHAVGAGDTSALRTLTSLAGKDTALPRILETGARSAALPALIAELDTPAPDPPRVSWQRGLDQAMLRTAWSREALSVFFACRTPVNNGHAHIDPMGFDFTALGRPVIVDPGRFTYREGDDRLLFKSARAHSTLTIDDKAPFEYLTTWTYSPQKPGAVIAVFDEPRVLAAAARHHNYEPAVHERLVAIVDGAVLLVLDRVTGLGAASTVEVHFHFDFTDVSHDDAEHVTVASAADTSALLCASGAPRVRIEHGRISDGIDRARPSRIVTLHDDGPGPSERCYAALIVPFTTGVDRPAVRKLEAGLDGGAVRCTFSLGSKPYVVRWSAQGIAVD